MNRITSKILYPQVLFLFIVFNFIHGQGVSQNRDKASFRTHAPDVLWTGTYTYGTTAKMGAIGLLKIYPVDEDDSSYIFYLEVNRGHPSYNSGALIGRINASSKSEGISKIIDNQTGVNCTLRFDFEKDTIVIKTDSISCICGFGYAVTADGKYKKTNAKIPYFFIDRHGDTIYFKSLTDESK